MVEVDDRTNGTAAGPSDPDFATMGTTPIRRPVSGGLYSRADFTRSLLIAGVVGLFLIIVNEGPDALLGLTTDPKPHLRTFLDILIPFLVASASAILANRRQVRAAATFEGPPRPK